MVYGIIDFDVMPDGSYLIASGIVDDSLNTLFHFDSTGAEIARHMPMLRVLPTGESENQLWDRVRHTNAAPIGGGRVATTVSILDSLWTLDLASGAVHAIQVRPPEYEPPTVSDPQLTRPFAEGNAWIASTTMIPQLFSSGNTVYVPFAKGIYFQSESSTLLVGGPSRPWRAGANVPVSLAGE